MPSAVKFVLVGDKGSGKTSLLHRHLSGSFLGNCAECEEEVRPCVGLNFHSVPATVGSRQYKQLIWDTTADPIFANVVRHYAGSEADAVVLVFDATRPETLDYLAPLAQSLRPDQCAILVGCKADLLNTQQQQQLELALAHRQLAATIAYRQVSAKTGEGVTATFSDLAEAVLKRRDAKAAAPSPPPVLSRRASWTKATLRRLKVLTRQA